MQVRAKFVVVACVSGLCSFIVILLIYRGDWYEVARPVARLSEGSNLESEPGGVDPRDYTQDRTTTSSRITDTVLLPNNNSEDGVHEATVENFPSEESQGTSGTAGDTATEAVRSEDTTATPSNATSLATCPTRVRWEHMDHVCREQGWAGQPIDWSAMTGLQLVVDHQHQLLCCLIPKSGTTSLRMFLGKLVIDLKHHMMYPLNTYLNYTGFQRLHWLSERKREKVLRDYMKIVVVRHPLGKLHSAYNNKMREAGNLNQQVLRGLKTTLADQYLHDIGLLATNETFDPLQHTLTFHQFLYLVGNKYAEGFVDEHWRTQQSACLLCQIRYDHYLRLETFEEDEKVITDYLASIGVPGDLAIDQQNAKPRPGDAPGIRERLKTIDEAFADVDEDVMAKLLAVYRNDFILFGYGWDREHGATCEVNKTSQGSCC